MLNKLRPPSTKISDPVVKLELEQVKNNTVLAASLGIASLIIGIAFNSFFPHRSLNCSTFAFQLSKSRFVRRTKTSYIYLNSVVTNFDANQYICFH